jgi:hypothetical protein
MVRDFDPSEILGSGIFSLNDAAGSLQDAASGDLASFGQNLLMALIPSPEKLGGVLAVATVSSNSPIPPVQRPIHFSPRMFVFHIQGVAQKEVVKDVTAEAHSTGIMDQITAAKARGRRASSTAKKCKAPGCNTFHFRVDGYCADHKHMGVDVHNSLAQSQTAALLKSVDGNGETSENVVHHLKAIALREEMLARAETFDLEITVDYERDAKAALGALAGHKQEVDDGELGQFYFQFKRLDVDADGVFTVADFNTWIYRVDPDFNAEPGTVEAWLRKATVDEKESFDFVGYYKMVLARREFEATNWGQPPGVEVPLEFKQTPFWDLRMIVLHAINKERSGWMLKRGYMMAKESLNSWKLRYLRTNTLRPYEPPMLEYWDAHPDVDPTTLPEGAPLPQMKGTIPLREIVLVDFSPKTSSPKGSDPKLLEAQTKVGMTVETELVMKITIANGRRFTFACELFRHAAASRLMVDWRENWGTKRIGKVVLRDWLNAAVVIAKIGMQKNAQADAQKIIADAAKKWTILPGGKAAAMKKGQQDAMQYIKDLVLTDRDWMMLRVVGLDDKNIDQLGGLALRGVQLWNASKGTLKQLDNQYCGGGVQMGVNGMITAVNVYNYAAAAKNAYNTNKWKVDWEPKSMQRACAVCCMTFKSMTLRKTHGKHHCRVCGKVVCHVCAANRIFMQVSNKFERVCNKCITDKDNRETVQIDVSLFTSCFM